MCNEYRVHTAQVQPKLLFIHIFNYKRKKKCWPDLQATCEKYNHDFNFQISQLLISKKETKHDQKYWYTQLLFIENWTSSEFTAQQKMVISDGRLCLTAFYHIKSMSL